MAQHWHWLPTLTAWSLPPGTPEHSSPGNREAHGLLPTATRGSPRVSPLPTLPTAPCRPEHSYTQPRPRPAQTPGTTLTLSPQTGRLGTAASVPDGHGSGAAFWVRYAPYSCWKGHTCAARPSGVTPPTHVRAHTHTRAPGPGLTPAGAVHPRGSRRAAPTRLSPRGLGGVCGNKGAGPSESYRST